MTGFDSSLPCPFCGTRPEDLQRGAVRLFGLLSNCRVMTERTVVPNSEPDAEETEKG